MDIFSKKMNKRPYCTEIQLNKYQHFFEGDFPVKLIGDDSVTIATAIESAEDSRMTDKFVSFSGSLEFNEMTAINHRLTR